MTSKQVPRKISSLIGAVIFLVLAVPYWSFLKSQTEVGLSQWILIVAFVGIATFCMMFWKEIKLFFKNFFSGKDDPINLAVCRIVLFGYLALIFDDPQALVYSHAPRELMFPPTGMGWVAPWIPFNEPTILFCAQAAKLFCFLSMCGLWTRGSMLLATFFTFYVLTIPQLFGKVNHYHHLVWFSLLVSLAPAGDALSIDAILKAVKRADFGIIYRSTPHNQYALPLRFIWILLGIIYFFPGFWKVWICGFDWALGDNLKYQMYEKWMSLDGWKPFFRIDHYPFLYKTLGLGTIFIEMSFIFLVLFPQTRIVAVILGLGFHTGTNLFMQIAFFSLVRCYTALVDWAKIFAFLGQKLFPVKAILIYDGNCELCRRTIAILNVFDILNRITYVNALNRSEIEKTSVAWIKEEVMMKDMCFVTGQKLKKGYEAYRALSWRIPFLWLAAPFLYLWPIPFFGKHIYRKIADSRRCAIQKPELAEEKNSGVQFSRQILVFCGTVLIVTNTVFGFLKIGRGWPFATYPTFAYIQEETIETLLIEIETTKGEKIEINNELLHTKIRSERLSLLYERILNVEDTEQKKEKLIGLWKLIESNFSLPANIKVVNFYELTESLSPEKSHLNPIAKKLVYKYLP